MYHTCTILLSLWDPSFMGSIKLYTMNFMTCSWELSKVFFFHTVSFVEKNPSCSCFSMLWSHMDATSFISNHVTTPYSNHPHFLIRADINLKISHSYFLWIESDTCWYSNNNVLWSQSMYKKLMDVSHGTMVVVGVHHTMTLHLRFLFSFVILFSCNIRWIILHINQCTQITCPCIMSYEACCWWYV